MINDDEIKEMVKRLLDEKTHKTVANCIISYVKSLNLSDDDKYLFKLRFNAFANQNQTTWMKIKDYVGYICYKI